MINDVVPPCSLIENILGLDEILSSINKLLLGIDREMLEIITEFQVSPHNMCLAESCENVRDWRMISGRRQGDKAKIGG